MSQPGASPAMDRAWWQRRLAGLAGSQGHVEVCLAEGLLNAFLQDVFHLPEYASQPVEAVRLEARAENAVAVQVRLRNQVNQLLVGTLLRALREKGLTIAIEQPEASRGRPLEVAVVVDWLSRMAVPFLIGLVNQGAGAELLEFAGSRRMRFNSHQLLLHVHVFRLLDRLRDVPEIVYLKQLTVRTAPDRFFLGADFAVP